jgi:hypothetical protein
MTDRAVFVLCWTALAAGALGAGEITPHGTQPPILQPIQDPSGCEGCHGHYDGAANIEPWNTWAGSMMAQAARDPIFWAALDAAASSASSTNPALPAATTSPARRATSATA